MPSDGALTPKEQLAWLSVQDNARLALGFVENLTAEQFAADRKTFYAVTRCLEIISEAAPAAARPPTGSVSRNGMAADREFRQRLPSHVSERGGRPRVDDRA